MAVICESLIQISRGPPSPARGAPAAAATGDDNTKQGEEDQMIVKDMLRQLLQNQRAIAATIDSLQQDVKELKDKQEVLASSNVSK